ncbi:hypothetical protein ACFV2Q_27675 [Streptomyces sp. NPDC059650]|uniref:hypothetical protein n=1 Tax=Streptomyces sp. NPDC059650 TaxID=3346896 RepID=UPI0036811269
MLASLLPGIRELRTPLATGYLYLLTLFLLIGGRIPAKAEAPDALKRLYDIVEWMGKPAALAATTFVAYLVGSVLEVRATTFRHRLRQPRARSKQLNQVRMEHERRERWQLPTSHPEVDPVWREMAVWILLSKSTVDTLVRYMFGRTGRLEVTISELLRAFVLLMNEFPQLRTRLYQADKDLYGDYDRLASEADFKVNIGAAAIVLSCVAATVVEPWWALPVGPMAYLIRRGFSTAEEANDALVQAVVTDVVKSPRFEERLSELSAGQSGPPDPGYL